MIPYGRQEVTEADIAAVERVLRSDFLTQGPVVPRLESTVADYCGAAQGVAVSSGTAALHVACLALDLGPGDWLWTSAVTFVASANCGAYCGAQVDLVDIDPETYNLCPGALARKLEQAEREGRLPKVVVPVHLCGQSPDMAAIGELAARYGFRVIEDASHAIGARYRDEQVGNCCYSDITVFSFHPVKLVTTGEGGMAVTNDGGLAERMAALRTHGITRDPARMSRDPDGPWYYEQTELGYNYRMTDIQAALGLSQLERLDQYVSRRHELAARYDELLADLPVVIPARRGDCYSAFHLYVIRLRLDCVDAGHREVFERLREAGIGVNLHYIPVYRQPYYAAQGFETSSFPEAEAYYAEAITLPLYPALQESEQTQVVEALRAACA